MSLRILPTWRPREGSPPEEKATGAEIRVVANNTGLTNFERNADGQIGSAPCLSAYPLASWLAWNWWRLHWESRYPRALKDPAWLNAHNMRRAGDGFVWPDITFASDGKTMLVMAKSTPEHTARPIRYITDFLGFVSVEDFASSADHFIRSTLSQLSSKNLRQTELEIFYNELIEERSDQDLARYRRLEAMLGHDPDDGDDAVISRLIDEMEEVSEDAIRELAALGASRAHVPSVQELREGSADRGFAGRTSDMVSPLDVNELPSYGDGPAWARGVEAARRLRDRERLNGAPIGDARLAEMAGLPERALHRGERSNDFTYAIAGNGEEQRVVQRSKWDTGRRFDVARLIGDCVAVQADARLRTATRMSTYRQQLQKAFAAEFLAPIEAVDEFLDYKYDEDGQEEAAQKFRVSPMMINSLLKNNNRIERSEYDVLDHLPSTVPGNVIAAA